MMRGQEEDAGEKEEKDMETCSREPARQAAAPIVLELLTGLFSVCRVADYSGINIDQPFCFTGRTDEEKSLVCPTELVPANTTDREDGWKALRVCGELNFSLIGIIAGISEVLASHRIGIFTVSTYNTDYILMKKENCGRAMAALKKAGYRIRNEEEERQHEDI